MTDTNMTPDEGVLAAMAIFDAIQPGDKAAYRAALVKGGELVPDAMKQMLMIDRIIAARHRAYSEPPNSFTTKPPRFL